MNPSEILRKSFGNPSETLRKPVDGGGTHRKRSVSVGIYDTCRESVTGGQKLEPVGSAAYGSTMSLVALSHAPSLGNRRTDLGPVGLVIAAAIVAVFFADAVRAAPVRLSVSESPDLQVVLMVVGDTAPTFQVYRQPGGPDVTFVVELPGATVGSAPLISQGPGVLLHDVVAQAATNGAASRVVLTFADDVDFDADTHLRTLAVKFHHMGDPAALRIAHQQRLASRAQQKLRDEQLREEARRQVQQAEEATRMAKRDQELARAAQQEAARIAKLNDDQKRQQAADAARVAALAAEQERQAQEAARQAKVDAEQKAQAQEAARQAKVDAEQKAKAEAARLAKIDAEQKAKAEAARLAKIDAEQKAKAEAARLAKIDAEQKAKAEAARQAKVDAEQKAKAEAARLAKIDAEQKANAEAARKAKIDAEQKAQAEAARLAKIDAEQKAKAEAARNASIDAEQKANAEAARLVDEARRTAQETDRAKTAQAAGEQQRRDDAARDAGQLQETERARVLAATQLAAAQELEQQRRRPPTPQLDDEPGFGGAKTTATTTTTTTTTTATTTATTAAVPIRLARATTPTPTGNGFGGGQAIDIHRGTSRYRRVELPSDHVDDDYGAADDDGEADVDESSGRSVLSQVTVQRMAGGARVGIRVERGARYHVARRGREKLVLTLLDTRAQNLDVRRVLDARSLGGPVLRVLPTVDEDRRFRIELVIETRGQSPVKVQQDGQFLWLEVME